MDWELWSKKERGLHLQSVLKLAVPTVLEADVVVLDCLNQIDLAESILAAIAAMAREREPLALGSGGPSALAEDDEPAMPAECRCAPCSAYRLLISPMFALVFVIVALNYAPYVLWTWNASLLTLACNFVFHVLLTLLLGSYLQCVFTDPGTVPSEWHRAVAADEQLSLEHRFDQRAQLYRPLRSHYCSVTRRVVLNMDHFCPWVVNTVGYYNRKFFVLFLLYTLATCAWVVLTLLPGVVELPSFRAKPGVAHWGPQRLTVVTMALLLDCALLLMLVFFGAFHVRMVLLNETTIEGHSPEYDVGYRRNWEQVMGSDPYYWFLPLWGRGPAGDGVHWPMRDFPHESERSIDREGKQLSMAPYYSSDDSAA